MDKLARGVGLGVLEGRVFTGEDLQEVIGHIFPDDLDEGLVSKRDHCRKLGYITLGGV
jgi:hypothetical protein